MAVPKKRRSKSKKNMRKAAWKRKTIKFAERSVSLTKSLKSNRETSFIDTITLKEKKENSIQLGF